MTLPQDMKYLFFHKNHAVSCPNIGCGNSVLRIENKTSRIDKDGETRIVYQCLLCYRKFACCAKRTNMGKLPLHKSALIKQIAGLRKQIRGLERQIYGDKYDGIQLEHIEEVQEELLEDSIEI